MAHAFVRGLLGWARHSYVRPLLAIPLIVAVVVYLFASYGILGWDNRYGLTTQLDLLHDVSLGGMGILSIVWWISTSEPAFALLAVMSGFPLAREILGGGYDEIVYAGVIASLMYGNFHGDKLRPFMKNPMATSLVATCLLCYFCSQLIDRGIMREIGRILMQDDRWRLRHSTQVEEALECTGGVLLFLTPIAVRIDMSRRNAANAVSPPDASDSGAR